MAGKIKYNTIEDVVSAWKVGELKLESLKKNYFYATKLGQERALFYKLAICTIEHIRVDEQWG